SISTTSVSSSTTRTFFPGAAVTTAILALRCVLKNTAMIGPRFLHTNQTCSTGLNSKGQSVTHKESGKSSLLGRSAGPRRTGIGDSRSLRHCLVENYAIVVGKPSVFGPAFSFKASVNSCKLETIWGALVRTVEASFSA